MLAGVEVLAGEKEALAGEEALPVEKEALEGEGYYGHAAPKCRF